MDPSDDLREPCPIPANAGRLGSNRLWSLGVGACDCPGLVALCQNKAKARATTLAFDIPSLTSRARNNERDTEPIDGAQVGDPAMTRPAYLRAQPAKREGKYRSRLEAKFAAWWAQDFPDHPALYEPYRLLSPKAAARNRGGKPDPLSTYLPDFVIPSARMIVEVKPHPDDVKWYEVAGLVDAMADRGWLFMVWSGDRRTALWLKRFHEAEMSDWRRHRPREQWEKDMIANDYDLGFKTPWSMMGSTFKRWLCPWRDPANPIRWTGEYASNVGMVSCETCGGPSPNWTHADEWGLMDQKHMPDGRNNLWSHTEPTQWEWGCFCCGGKIARADHRRFDFPRRESLINIYRRPLNEWEIRQ